MRLFLLLVTAVFLDFAALGASVAQTYPAKPIRLISPYASGGGTDILARLIGQKLAEQLGQSVIVDNRPGAGGIIGTEIVAKSPADGYTIMLASPSPIVVAPHLHKKLAYNPLKDLAPITLISVVPAVLVVHPSLPAKSVRELIAVAKSKPGQLTFSSSGKIVKVLRSPEMKQNLSSEGADPIGSTPAEFAKHLQAETERWGKVVRQAQLKID